jgi:hypothetical protein
MKQISLILITLLVIVSVIVACGHENETHVDSTDSMFSSEITDVPLESEKDAHTIEPPVDESIRGWFTHGSDLILRDKFEENTASSYTVNMVRNEREGLQYILTSDVDYEDLHCEVSTLSDGKGNTLDGTVFVAWNEFIYFTGNSGFANRGYTPSALLPQDDPFQGGTFDLKAGRSKTLYIRFETNANTVPGDYTGVLEVKHNGNVLLTGDVTVKVFDITFDEHPDCITAFGNPNHYSGWEVEGPTGEYGAPSFTGNIELTAQYYEFLLDQWLSGGTMPVGDNGVLDENAAKYLNDPRLTMTFLSQQDDLHLQYEACLENQWLDKIVFLIWDEPTTEEQIVAFRRAANLIRNKFETTKLLVNTHVDIPSGDMNIIERIAEFSTIHCTAAPLLFGDSDLYETLMNLKHNRGDTVMWYVCGSSRFDEIDVLNSIPGTLKRILYWQQYLYDIDGFLYFHTTWWADFTDNLWDDGYEEVNRNKPISSKTPVTGNGLMMFWHPTTKAPVGTLGLESMRDGVEDFELIKMAESLLGKDATMAYVNRVTTSDDEFVTDSDAFEAVRVELMKAIESSSKQ